MPERLSDRVPLLILALSLVVVFHRLLLGEVFFWGLPALQFYPWREYAFDVLRQGQLPMWNSYNGAGAPVIANYQSALFYPPNWPGFILPLASSMSVTAVLHLFIAGWGMWAFTGRLGISSLGRGVSALAFGMTSYLVARLGTYPTISAAAWIPWILWAMMRVLTDGRRCDAGWLAIFAALQLLAGHAQTTWYSMLLAGVFSIWWMLKHRSLSWRSAGLLVFVLALALGIAAIQLLPTAELLVHSQRSDGIDFDFAMNFSYRPASSLNFLSPNVFGNPGDGTYILKDKGAFFEDAVYIGLIPLISALAAVISWFWGKLRRSEHPAYFVSIPLWLMVIAVGYIFALGDHLPVFPFLYEHIPTFDLFQAPVRWHIWTVFALSVLAGIGIGVWGRGHWLFFGTRLAVAACIGASVLALLSPRFLPPELVTNDGVQVFIHAVAVTGIFGALAGVLTLSQPEQTDSQWYPWWSVAVLLVIAADLAYAAQGLNPTVPSSFYDRGTPANRGFSRTYWPQDAEDGVRFQTFLRFDDYRIAADRWQDFRATELPNLNLLDRAYSLNNFDPLLVSHLAAYIDMTEANPAERDRLLQSAGVNAVYDANGELVLLEQPAARAWFAAAETTPDCLGDSTVYALLSASQQADANTGIYLDCQENLPANNAFGEVQSIRDNGNVVELTVDVAPDQAGNGAWLVLADIYYPGWEVTLDGVPAEIKQANLAFRAVWVPNTVEIVRFEYHPWWLLPGALLSITSIFVLLILFRTKNPT